MKNLKKKFQFRIHLKSKHLLVIMTFFCGSAVVSTLASGVTSEPLAEAAGMIVVPFEKSIDGIGSWIGEISQTFQDKQELINKNQELQDAVDTLTEQNNILIQNQSELSRLQELYKLDEEYSSYPKVAARIISKDPGNWYDTFMINRGSNDGIRVDNNVISGKGSALPTISVYLNYGIRNCNFHHLPFYILLATAHDVHSVFLRLLQD